MSLLKSFLSLTLGTSIVLAQTSEAPRPKASDEVKKSWLEARKMRLEHRYSEALEKWIRGRETGPNLADIYALRGEHHLAPRRRDFDLALPEFQKRPSLSRRAPCQGSTSPSISS